MIINGILIIFFAFSIIYSFKYKFMQLKFIKMSKKALRNKSSYMTFLLSLASHLGAGNIVGVTTALIYGGEGSLFWMWIATIFSSIFSLIENTLSIKYRETFNNECRSGACYYIDKGLHMPKLAIFFSFTLLLTNTIFFGPIQVNTISETILYLFDINKNIILIILLLFVFFVVFKGTKRITSFIEKIVPFMSLTFILISIIVIIINMKYIPNIFINIIKDAFSLKSIKGGITGSVLMIGLKRSYFSNEAGLGTAPSISGMSSIDSPIHQGYVQVLCVVVDTIIMCTLMGFMILIYNVNYINYKGVDLAIYVFEVIFGNFGKYIGAFLLLSFSLSTVISNFYSGETNTMYIINKTKFNKKKGIVLFKSLYISGIIIGIYATLITVWNIIDYGIILLGMINLFTILCLQKKFKEEII